MESTDITLIIANHDSSFTALATHTQDIQYHQHVTAQYPDMVNCQLLSLRVKILTLPYCLIFALNLYLMPPDGDIIGGSPGTV